MDIILIGRVAEKGTIDAVAANLQRVEERFPKRFLKKGIAGCSVSFIDEQNVSMLTKKCEFIYPLNGESIYDALWQLGVQYDTGLRVVLEDIAITGFVIAVADLLDESPYNYDSTGCMLAICKDSGPVLSELAEAGIQASVIGYAVSDKKRCIVNNGIMTFLTKPARKKQC